MAETLEQKALRIAQETGLDPVNVLQGMQMGDADFIRAIAPYVNDPADIDLKKARFHGFTEAEAGRTGTYGFKGFSVPKRYSKEPMDNPYLIRTDDGMLKQIPKEAGTVNAVNEGSAVTWAHEYRHQLGQDGGGEGWNRKIDLITADTLGDWKKALKFMEDDELATLLKKQKRKLSKEDREALNKRLATAKTVYKDAIKKDTPETTAALKKHLKDTKKLDYIKYFIYDEEFKNNPMHAKYPSASRRWKKFVSDDWEADKDKDLEAQKKKAKSANTFWDAI